MEKTEKTHRKAKPDAWNRPSQLLEEGAPACAMTVALWPQDLETGSLCYLTLTAFLEGALANRVHVEKSPVKHQLQKTNRLKKSTDPARCDFVKTKKSKK